MASQALVSKRYAIAIHGGAGVITTHDPVALGLARKGLERALQVGRSILEKGGSSLDAVEQVVVELEDDPCFNAGRGSVLGRSGHHELEASIMTCSRKCGAVTLLRRVKNPIKLARAVMERTPHIFIGGEEAEKLAESWGLELVDNSYFTTEQRRQQWLRYREGEGHVMHVDEIVQHGQTVGAVAIDWQGRLAAATSTGGRTNKWDGRIGDTPIIGAGNWASSTCAVSGTGMGEQFLRHCICHDLAARIMYGGASLAEAAHQVVNRVLEPGDGGVVCVDKDYNMAMVLNSAGMYRGCADHTGRFEVAIFANE